MTTLKPKPRRNLISLLFGILIDLILIGMGVACYFYFTVYSFWPMEPNPIVVQIFGSQYLAVLVVSGVLCLVGAISLFRTSFRVLKR